MPVQKPMVEVNAPSQEKKPAKRKLLLYLLVALAVLLFLWFAGPRLLAHLRLTYYRILWQSHHIEDYRYTLDSICFCPGIRPATIEVREGTAVSTTYAEPIFDVDPSLYARTYAQVDTIEKLFARISSALWQADTVTVRYNRQYGYPVEASIDYDRYMHDDEIMYRISGWTELK